MYEYQVISCPKCGQKLKVPSNIGMLKVKCTKCGVKFFISKKGEIHKPYTTPNYSLRKKKLIPIIISIIVLSILIGLIYHFYPFATIKKVVKTRWVTISYADLLEVDKITSSGLTLQSALQDPSLRGEVQPFVDKYSNLLQYTVEMILGPDSLPHHNVVDHYPIGSKQPVWIAIFRGGRVCVTTDNQYHTRIFLLGDNPEIEFEENYSILRHCLAGLLPNDGAKLTVEVFTYKNNYSKSELILNLNPYIFESNNFPTPDGTVPIDLVGLQEFFNKNGQLEGAELNRKDGLILYAKKGNQQTLMEHNISLSDIAVSYRAVFHAGDNDAFVSLDPHKDPTTVTVNFGGLLENTRIGSVVLEADKRFKTITSGLDPNTYRDVRNLIRPLVPAFLTVAERDLLIEHFTTRGNWIGTRFWYYPESIEIETDFDYRYALIVNPRFTADAERSMEDFASLEEFERKKKETLSPSIRRNINHLNHNYTQYADAFPEMQELTSVARLMGICSWLKKANPYWLDLDALLSVELPPHHTDREKTQLIATSFISFVESEGLDEDYVKSNSEVVFLTPILDKTVVDYFSNSNNIAKYLCFKNGVDSDFSNRYISEANNLMQALQNKKVKEMIKTEEDLKGLAYYASNEIEFPLPSIVKKYDDEIKSYIRQLENINSKIDKLKIKINEATNASQHNLYVEEHNRLVYQYESIREKHNHKVDIIKRLNVLTPSIVEISGGINLKPEYFYIKKTSTSTNLQTFKNITKKTGLKWNSINGSGTWIRSRTKRGGSSYKNPLPKFNWIPKSVIKSTDTDFEYLNAGSQHNYWVSANTKTDSWYDLLELEESSYRDRMFDGTKKILHIAEFKSGECKNYIVGKMISKDKIVFHKSPRQDLLKPKEPPIWWIND